jgi:hypothetical protein
VEWSGIKFPEARGTGVWLRSQRMKLPPGVGQRKTKAIEQELRVMNIGKLKIILLVKQGYYGDSSKL